MSDPMASQRGLRARLWAVQAIRAALAARNFQPDTLDVLAGQVRAAELELFGPDRPDLILPLLLEIGALLVHDLQVVKKAKASLDHTAVLLKSLIIDDKPEAGED